MEGVMEEENATIEEMNPEEIEAQERHEERVQLLVDYMNGTPMNLGEIDPLIRDVIVCWEFKCLQRGGGLHGQDGLFVNYLFIIRDLEQKKQAQLARMESLKRFVAPAIDMPGGRV
jgi:hypothetical protein